MTARDPVSGKFVSELAAGFLSAYLSENARRLNPDVESRLGDLWAATRAQLGETASGKGALEQFEHQPGDPAARGKLESELRTAASADDEFAAGVDNWLQHVDNDVLAVWIASETTTELETVLRVLDVEWEFMVGVGIVNEPERTFLYYKREDLANLPQEVDVALLGNDAARFLGIPVDVAIEVLEAETRYLQIRGIAGLDEEPEPGHSGDQHRTPPPN